MKKKIEKSTWIKIGVIVAIVIAILVVDLVSKYVLDATLEEEVSAIPGLFNFVMTHNYGAAWNILSGKQLFLIAISVVFLAAFTWYFCLEKKKTWLLCIGYAFLVGGCLGNLYDRIFLGYVRDFIQFDFWQSFPIFNFADVFLTFGVVLFVIYLILFFVFEHKNSKLASEAEKENEGDLEEDEQSKSLDEKCKKIDEKLAKNAKKIEKTRKKQEKEAKTEVLTTQQNDEKKEDKND